MARSRTTGTLPVPAGVDGSVLSGCASEWRYWRMNEICASEGAKAR